MFAIYNENTNKLHPEIFLTEQGALNRQTEDGEIVVHVSSIPPTMMANYGETYNDNTIAARLARGEDVNFGTEGI